MNSTSNVQEWVKLIEVDWLGQYSKAWIAFNAWYRSHYNIKDDRKIIEKIKKNQKTKICLTIENYLGSSGELQRAFKSNIAKLHNSLIQENIKSNNKIITFEAVEDYLSIKPIEENNSGIIYNIAVNVPSRQRLVRVKNSLGEYIFEKTIEAREEELFQGVEWFDTLVKEGYFGTLTSTQRNYLRVYIDDSSPLHNLLTLDPNSTETPTKIGTYTFTNDKKLIARALIEILYKLRNSLFHGEITPKRGVQNAYEPAYLILKWIIQQVEIENRSKQKGK